MNIGKDKMLPVAIAFLLNGCTGLSGHAQEQVRMTFGEAYGYMQQNSHTIKQSVLQVRQKEAEEKASAALKVPQLGITGMAASMSKSLHLDLTPVRDAITPLYETLGTYGNFSGLSDGSAVFPEAVSTTVIRQKMLEASEEISQTSWDQTIQEKQFASLSANISWPIYAGGKIRAANNAARISTREAGLKMEQKKAELLSELVTRYYGLVLSRESERVRRQVLEVMEKHLYDARKLLEQGQIAQVEELHAEVARADAERELLKAGRQTSILSNALQNTLALSGKKSPVPASGLFMLNRLEEVAYFIDLAKRESPLLRQISTKKKLAETGIKAQKSTYLPSVALTGTYELANKDLSPYIPEWLVGMGLNWTLFDGASGYRKLQAARLRAAQIDEAGEKAEDNMETLVRKLHHELGMLYEQMESLNKTLAFAESYAESKNRAFLEGLTSSSEQVDAQLMVSKFKIERLQIMYRYDVTLAALLQHCGVPDRFLAYQQSRDLFSEK
ncbi:MAG: TolC family protein [Mangrovibacterium sp.]